MEAKAIEKYLKISSRKIKFVADVVRSKPVEEAIGILSLTPKRAAVYVKKAIQSAAANAMENFKEYKLSEDNLFVKEIYATEGPTLKRFKPRARGRADRVLKRTSHITVMVSDEMDRKSIKKSVSKAGAGAGTKAGAKAGAGTGTKAGAKAVDKKDSKPVIKKSSGKTSMSQNNKKAVKDSKQISRQGKKEAKS